MADVYRGTSLDARNKVGRVESTGDVYRDSSVIGHVDEKGMVYPAGSGRGYFNIVGTVDKKGFVYRGAIKQHETIVASVDSSGVVHAGYIKLPTNILGKVIGTTDIYHIGAAALLLLL